jgi:N-acetylglucosamine-6-sulfatase
MVSMSTHQSKEPHQCRRAPRYPLWGLLLGLAVNLTACRQEELSPSPPRGHVSSPQPVIGAAGKPNIVVIMTDDEQVADMHVMSHTLDLIGSAGVTFDNSVVTQSLCCPSRSTFLTGQYPHNHGVRSNAPPDGGYTALDPSNTLPVWLQAAGYATAHIGKYLNGYGTVNPLETVPGWTEWYFSTAKSDYHYYNYLLNENGTEVSYGSTAEEYKTDVFTNKAVDFITRRAPDAVAGVAPFFLFVSYLANHGGLPDEPGDPKITGTPVVAPRHQGALANEPLPAWPSLNEADVSDKPAIIRSHPLLTADQLDQERNGNEQRLESLLSVDEGVERIVDALDQQGVLANTLIIFLSDNGWLQGQHRIKKGKDLPYAASVKVPLLIRGPGVVAGLHITAPVANIDVAPTIVQAAGATAGRTMDGLSLYSFLTGAKTSWLTGRGPRHILVETSQLQTADRVFWSIREGNLVYTEYNNGDREFYNLKTDPDEMRSRHNDPATASARRRLKARLAAMKACVGPVACW